MADFLTRTRISDCSSSLDFDVELWFVSRDELFLSRSSWIDSISILSIFGFDFVELFELFAWEWLISEKSSSYSFVAEDRLRSDDLDGGRCWSGDLTFGAVAVEEVDDSDSSLDRFGDGSLVFKFKIGLEIYSIY